MNYIVCLIFNEVEAESASEAAASIYKRLQVEGGPPLPCVAAAYGGSEAYQSWRKHIKERP
jgi:hypothetical protein